MTQRNSGTHFPLLSRSEVHDGMLKSVSVLRCLLLAPQRHFCCPLHPLRYLLRMKQAVQPVPWCSTLRLPSRRGVPFELELLASPVPRACQCRGTRSSGPGMVPHPNLMAPTTKQTVCECSDDGMCCLYWVRQERCPAQTADQGTNCDSDHEGHPRASCYVRFWVVRVHGAAEPLPHWDPLVHSSSFAQRMTAPRLCENRG
jgi:hypothetical protein